MTAACYSPDDAALLRGGMAVVNPPGRFSSNGQGDQVVMDAVLARLLIFAMVHDARDHGDGRYHADLTLQPGDAVIAKSRGLPDSSRDPRAIGFRSKDAFDRLDADAPWPLVARSSWRP